MPTNREKEEEYEYLRLMAVSFAWLAWLSLIRYVLLVFFSFSDRVSSGVRQLITANRGASDRLTELFFRCKKGKFDREFAADGQAGSQPVDPMAPVKSMY